MANYAVLKAAVAAVVKTNGNQEITGNNLQLQLINIINTLTEGYQFLGVATPDTEYTAGDANVAFLAATAGTYADMGDLELAEGEVAVLKYNGTAWSKDTALTGVAFRDGNYPSLISGAAQNLVGHGSVGAEYTRRTSGGSADIGTGAAQITKMRGKTIVWNQLVDADTTEVTIPSGHKYFAVINGAASVATSDGTAIAVTGGQDMVVDLTLMGTASEISTAADFFALYPGIYAACAGKLKNNDALAVVTTGFNQWDEELEEGVINSTTGQNESMPGYSRSKNYIPVFPSTNYYANTALYLFGYDANKNFVWYDNSGSNSFTTPTDVRYLRFSQQTADLPANICINLSWSGYRNGEYESYWKSTLNLGLNALACHDENDNAVVVNGLDGVGTAYDEGVVENGMLTKIVKRFAEVDLGDLYWSKTTTSGKTIYYSDTAIQFNSAYGICSRYVLSTDNDWYDTDKTIRIYRPSSAWRIGIRDSSYDSSDAATFKTAMSGVKLRYELATPLVLTIDNPIPVSYRVDDFGTEERTSPVDADGAPSAPIVYDVKYAMNAVDTLRRLPENYISKDSAENLLEALKTAGIISAYTMTYNSTTGEYDFTITAPEEPAEPAEE